MTEFYQKKRKMLKARRRVPSDDSNRTSSGQSTQNNTRRKMSTNSESQGKTLITCKSDANNDKLDCKPENVGMVRKKQINAGLKKLRKPISNGNIEACQKLTTTDMKTNNRHEPTNSRAQVSHQTSTISNVTSTRKIVGKTLIKKIRAMKNLFTGNKMNYGNNIDK